MAPSPVGRVESRAPRLSAHPLPRDASFIFSLGIGFAHGRVRLLLPTLIPGTYLYETPRSVFAGLKRPAVKLGPTTLTMEANA
jgi:hypothetical protein